ncbi:hypothetical protein [Janibacter sp. GS2]|uniref:hypothetical protein n=1 Tax=Janibacter sp. GS2 TaxID=3442646 RepID=UPI003EB8C317
MRRRSVVKGAAWATPTIVLGNAAPAMAASRPPGLQGWVTVGKSCGNGPDTLTIDGTGGDNANPPTANSRGIWVFNVTSSTVLTNARLTVYYPSSLGTIGWTAASGNSGWSVPSVDNGAPPKAGFIAYTSTYSGAWTFYNNPNNLDDHFRANGRPNFTASVSLSGSYCATNGLPLYSLRRVTIDGNLVDFGRGPVYL